MSTKSGIPVSSLFNVNDQNVRVLKYRGATIRLLVNDLKSKKNLSGKNAEILFAKESMGRYIGKIHKGVPHGYGVKVWPDGKKYQGNWIKGKMHGNGELLISEGESFTGEFKFGLPWGLI